MDYAALAIAFLSFLGLLLHAFGKNHPKVEAAAEVVDKVDAGIKTVSGK